MLGEFGVVVAHGQAGEGVLEEAEALDGRQQIRSDAAVCGVGVDQLERGGFVVFGDDDLQLRERFAEPLRPSANVVVDWGEE